MIMTNNRRNQAVGVGILMIFALPFVTFAEETCGDIVSINPYSGDTEQVAIEDCSDPFVPNQSVPDNLDLRIEGVAVNEVRQVEIPGAFFSSVDYAGAYRGYLFQMYEQVGDEYEQIDLRPANAGATSVADVVAIVEEYYAEDPDLDVYRQVVLTNDRSELTEAQSRSFSNFEFTVLPAALQELSGVQIPVGRYWLVFTEEVLCLSQSPTQRSWVARLLHQLIPTAHAQSADRCAPGYVPKRFVVEVDITQAPEDPIEELTGASSVLFLPGIMGSRLYEESDVCGDEVTEQQRWFSFSECDQLRLLTRFDGATEHDIYTKAIDDAVIDSVSISTLYEDFLAEMNELEESEVIADFTPFAYDWRLRLDDLLQTTKDPVTNEVRFDSAVDLEDSHIYQTVASMVDDSHSGKVTIVAHSNGGLLAKTFMSALQAKEDPLADKIDNLILVASPQVGTPDAVVGMLQGTEIVGGLIASQTTTRELLNTGPFGHHLLPSAEYFAGSGVQVTTPVISFESGSSTDGWREGFGPAITDSQNLHQFLSRDSGRAKPVTDDLYQPEVVDNYLLNYADTIAAVQASWVPQPNTKVYQIAGAGVETASGITYFTDTECIAGGSLWFECQEYAPKLGYYVNFTHDGDGTVVVPSALGMQAGDSVERWWLDLQKTGGIHKNILETPELITFIEDAVQSTSTLSSLEHLSRSPITTNTGNRLNFFLLSPLDMYLQGSAGITSSSSDEIPGATYRQYGAVQYVSVPGDSNGLTLHLNGYEAGSFTLLVQETDDGEVVHTRDFTAIPTGSSTIVQLPLDDLQPDTTLEIDFDGDGTLDGVVSAESDRATPLVTQEDGQVNDSAESKPNSSPTIGTRIRPSTPAATPPGEVAGVSISGDKQWYYKELQKILGDIADLVVLIEAQYDV